MPQWSEYQGLLLGRRLAAWTRHDSDTVEFARGLICSAPVWAALSYQCNRRGRRGKASPAGLSTVMPALFTAICRACPVFCDPGFRILIRFHWCHLWNFVPSGLQSHTLHHSVAPTSAAPLAFTALAGPRLPKLKKLAGMSKFP